MCDSDKCQGCKDLAIAVTDTRRMVRALEEIVTSRATANQDTLETFRHEIKDLAISVESLRGFASELAAQFYKDRYELGRRLDGTVDQLAVEIAKKADKS